MTVCDSSTKLTGISVRIGNALPRLPATARRPQIRQSAPPAKPAMSVGRASSRSQVMDEIAKAGEQQAVNDQLKTNGFVHRANDRFELPWQTMHLSDAT